MVSKTLTNCYINLSRLNKPSCLDKIFTQKCIHTNIDNIDQFKSDLISYERNQKTNNHKHIYGVLLTFLLDKDHMNVALTELVEEIAKRYDNLPFYAYKGKEGKGTYINMYICERHYFPESIKKEVLAKNDLYKNSKTHKYCSKEDPDSYLYKRKGEVLKTKKEKFTKKTDFFRFKENLFNKIWEEFKLWFMELLNRLFDMPIEEGVSLKQYVVHNMKNKFKAQARVWNDFVRYANYYIGLELRELHQYEDFSSRFKKKVDDIIGDFLNILDAQEFELNNIHYFISFYKEDANYTKGAGMLLIEKLRCMFRKNIKESMSAKLSQC